MIDSLEAALRIIERALSDLRREVLLASLQGGISPSQTRASLRSVDLPSTDELEDLYGWRNGTRTDRVNSLDDLHLIPGFYLLSIEDAVANYRAFVADPRWSPGWLPVLSNGGGDFYVVDLTGPRSGAIRHFRIEERDHPIEFHSILTLLATCAEAYSRGVFFVDSEGYLEMTDENFAELAASMNPDVPWWSE